MILIDSNVPMYLIGATHPHKADAQVTLSFDRHFDDVPRIERVASAQESWRT